MENNNTSTAKMPSSSSSSSSSSKLRSKILKILPKAAAAVTMTFQNPPFSPGRDHHKPRSDHNNVSSATTTTTTRLKPHGNKGFSGPIMIPDEVRRKPKEGDGIEAQEPTSPKVSCIGQIKHNKKKQIKKQDPKSMSLPVVATTPKEETRKTEENKMKKQGSKRFQRMLNFNTGKPKTGVRKSSASPSSAIGGERNTKDGASDNNAPPIGYMRRFASGRETFANFDWKAQIAPEEMNRRDFYSEDDKAESDAGEEEEEEEEEEDEIMIPFSAPIGGRGGGGNGGFGGGFGGGGGVNLANLQPRKEINLWKRRTMAQPRPLQLNPVLTASSK